MLKALMEKVDNMQPQQREMDAIRKNQMKMLEIKKQKI